MTMDKTILAISGKPGLFVLLSQGRSTLIVETLDDQKKRFSVGLHDKITSLNDVSMYTDDDNIPLMTVFNNIKEMQDGHPVAIDPKKASRQELENFMAKALPTYDRDRVYQNDIRKLISWYNILVQNNLTDFSLPEEEKEDSILLKMNLDMVETFFSSNSLNNSNISKDTNNNDKTIVKNNPIPFNIKNKFGIMQYKYSGYVKKKSKTNDELNSINSVEKGNLENEESLVKEGFGKFHFKDGSEFCGIFHNNIFQNYGKYLFLNNKENNIIKQGDKEILITDNNINYEEFIGEYKNYIPEGFGIYTNLITNLKITGIFGQNGLYGIGIENSVEGGYTYYGEFKNNKKEGIGTILWKDGSKYEGQFNNNQMNGYGMMEFPEKNYYQGEIKNGKIEGFGQFFWSDKRKYVGHYKNDKRNGFGVYIFKNNEGQNDDFYDEFDMSNSSAFIGFWKNGTMDGFGMMIIHSEIKYGIWENGFKKKNLENNTSLLSYAKWMNKRYNKLFIEKPKNIFDFLETIFNINNEFEASDINS